MLLVIDTETTGLDPAKHACIELGAVLLDRHLKIVKEFSQIITPRAGAEISPQAMEINKITDEELSKGKTHQAATKDFNRIFFSENIGPIPKLAGWNVGFDVSFLKSLYYWTCLTWPFGFHYLDIQSIYSFCSKYQTVSLRAAIADQLGEVQGHRALEDAKHTARILASIESNVTR